MAGALDYTRLHRHAPYYRYFIETEDGEIKGTNDIMEWATYYETTSRIVMKTQVLHCTVSTVFLGLDHGFCDPDEPDYQPVLYETMVFGKPTGHGENREDLYMERYKTRQQAIEGHEATLSRLRDALNIEGVTDEQVTEILES